ncbi:MAG: hypothetical protein HYX61_08700 [Gammaproteobacteria bacterium]|jgi:hypothetical protein|nr:hypothetical protein [Gammaproteobacteria bacterium]
MLSGQEKSENVEMKDKPKGVVQHFKNNWHRYGMWTLGTVGSLGVDYALGAPVTSIFNPFAVLAASTIYGLPAVASTVAYDNVVQKSKKRKHEEVVNKDKPTTSIQLSDVAESAIQSTPVLLFQAQEQDAPEKENNQNEIISEANLLVENESVDESVDAEKSSSDTPKAKRQKTRTNEVESEESHEEQHSSDEKSTRKVRRNPRRNSRKGF